MNILAKLQDIHDNIFILGHTEIARKNLINLIQELSSRIVIENGKPTGTISILEESDRDGNMRSVPVE